ncbi:MAG: GNAT family N-acetyltransferase [Bdellovibrionaceae bacterium]|nr:GNAT family N-acetyltransferase [Pseudobdellovibrionaceae bacterium]
MAEEGPQKNCFDLSPEDWEEVARWLPNLRAQLDCPAAFSWSREQFLGLRLHTRARVLRSLSEIVAFLCFNPIGDTAEILVVATHPEHWGRGAARGLIKAVINAEQHKVWWLEVHERNRRAIGLYENLGFRAVGRRPKYYSDGGDALLMEFVKN